MSGRQPIIYVVDDDASVCRALSLLLKSHGFQVKTFTRAKDFLASKPSKTSACLVLDVRLPDINGLALQDAMIARHQYIPIVFITGHGNIPMSVKAMKEGAIDFLPKPFTNKELLDAIDRAIAKNKIYNKEHAEVEKIRQDIKTLSPREREVFCLVAKGMLSKQIAAKRGTSLQTIKVHRAHVMQKMHTKTLAELIFRAQKVGLSSFCK